MSLISNIQKFILFSSNLKSCLPIMSRQHSPIFVQFSFTLNFANLRFKF
nr:MAG TPA: hypothetical protein [Caudoviricetes sp.]